MQLLCINRTVTFLRMLFVHIFKIHILNSRKFHHLPCKFNSSDLFVSPFQHSFHFLFVLHLVYMPDTQNQI